MRPVAIKKHKNSVVIDAITHRHFNLFKRLTSKNVFTRYDADTYCQEAAKVGAIDIIKHIHRHNPLCFTISHRIFYKALEGGHIEIIRYLYENGCEQEDSLSSIYAARSGNLEVFDLLHKFGCQFTNCAYNTAARYGHVDIIKWLKEKNIPMNHNMVCVGAAENGHFEILKWLLTFDDGNGIDQEIYLRLDPIVCAYAAKGGQFEILKWLVERGCPISSHSCVNAAANGHLEILQWLHEKNGLELTVDACNFAVRNGHIEILKWLLQNECPWDDRSCTDAAKNNHLEILKWLHENGCPINYEAAYIDTARSGHREILEWLISTHLAETGIDENNSRSFCRIQSSAILTYAAQEGNFEIVKWLHEKGFPFNESTCIYAVFGGNFEILEWLKPKFDEIGWPFRKEVCMYAASKGHLEILKWLRSFSDGEECPWNYQECVTASDKNGHDDIVRWLKTEFDEDGHHKGVTI